MNQTQNEKFRERLEDFDTAVLITHAHGELRSRPMAIAGVDADCGMWFFTSKESAKVHEIERDTRVNIVCQHGWSACVCANGYASLERDLTLIERLWSVAFQVWFPRGATDPDIVLIHVRLEKGEYWDNTGLNRFSYAYESVKAIVTGKKPQVKEGEQHGKIDLGR